MSTKEIESKVTELKELKAMQEELQAEITALEDVIKAEMQRIGSDTLQAGIFKVLYKTVKNLPASTQKPSERPTAHYMSSTANRPKAAAFRLCEVRE